MRNNYSEIIIYVFLSLLFAFIGTYFVFIFGFAIGYLSNPTLRWILPIDFPLIVISPLILGVCPFIFIILIYIFLRHDLINLFGYLKKFKKIFFLLVWAIIFLPLGGSIFIRNELQLYNNTFPIFLAQSLLLTTFVWLFNLGIILVFRQPEIQITKELINLIEKYEKVKKQDSDIIWIIGLIYIFGHIIHGSIIQFLEPSFSKLIVPIYKLKFSFTIQSIFSIFFQILPFLLISFLLIWKRETFLVFIDIHICIFRGDQELFTPLNRFSSYLGIIGQLDKKLEYLGLDITNEIDEPNSNSLQNHRLLVSSNLILIPIMIYMLWKNWWVLITLSLELIISSILVDVIPEDERSIFDI